MSYRGLGQDLAPAATVAPPPPQPRNWWAVAGWGLVVATAVGIFWGTTSGVGRPVRSNRRRSSGRRKRRTSRRSSRRVRRNPVSAADKKFATKLPDRFGVRGEAGKKLRAEIKRRLPAPTEAEIKRWNRDRGTDIMDTMDVYAKRTGLPRWTITYVLQLGWQNSKGKLRPNTRRTSKNPRRRRTTRRNVGRKPYWNRFVYWGGMPIGGGRRRWYVEAPNRNVRFYDSEAKARKVAKDLAKSYKMRTRRQKHELLRNRRPSRR